MNSRRVGVCTLIIFTFCCGILLSANAQIRDDKASRNPYYIDFNNSAQSNVFEIQDGLLSIQYNDKYGHSQDLILKIYDWKRKVIAQYNVRKTFGMNYFNINISDDVKLEDNRVYSCVALNEARQKFEIFFKPIPPLEKEGPVINILVNPISFKCEDPNGNTVEFYGDIKEGKAPYTVNWYVMNNTRTDFIYQPRTESIARPGYTTIIRVDKNPDYYVMLLVKDACGMESRQMVHLMCGNKNKKVNTVFVEPLQALPGNLKGIK